MIGGAIKKKLSNMSGSGSTIMMILGFVLMMLIKMYLVKMSYNIIAPKIMKDDEAYKLTMRDAFFLVIILMS
jgi:mannose/fructose-specific phosphotransferase system component IIA|tara:strand:- start:504 stop:719 length:216 start_codon:yes stop_codon:yes gene_type:complete